MTFCGKCGTQVNDGGSPVPATQTLEAGAHPSTVADPVKDGFTFLGWFDGDTKVTLSTYEMPEGNKTLTAKWEKIIEKPSVTEKSDKLETPETGDSTNLWIPLVIAGLSLSAIICLIRKKRKAQ